ncbi:MAG: hypothetical protein IJX85_01525 [Lachnospiraceae bacterium]|nr:hypothetical protein [Lachnospiraceae bacterium]
MKKRLAIAIMLTGLMLGLCGCDGKGEDTTTATNPVEPYADMIDDVNSQVSEDYQDMDNMLDNLDDYQ